MNLVEERAKVALDSAVEKADAAFKEMQNHHEVEIARTREEGVKAKDEARGELKREREENQLRMEERLDQIKSLQRDVDAARSRVENIHRESESAKLEMEASRVEVQFKTETAQELRTENQKLHDEVKALKRVHEQAAELRESLR